VGCGRGVGESGDREREVRAETIWSARIKRRDAPAWRGRIAARVRSRGAARRGKLHRLGSIDCKELDASRFHHIEIL
jgi:hypothetical protein